jgi:hypothetical protein
VWTLDPQIPERWNADAGAFEQTSKTPKLTLTSGEDDRVVGKALYFLRTNPRGVAAGDKLNVGDMASGVVAEGALESLSAVVNAMYLPALRGQKDWGKLNGTADMAANTDEFLGDVRRFGAAIAEAAASLRAVAELAKPASEYVASVELKPSAFKTAAEDAKTLFHMNRVLDKWVFETNALVEERQPVFDLEAGEASPGAGGAARGKRSSKTKPGPGGGKENAGPNAGPSAEPSPYDDVADDDDDDRVPRKKRPPLPKESPDAGPDTELNYWRTRMGVLNSIAEQLKARSPHTGPRTAPFAW